jgi:hypothetical protein
MNRYIYTQEFIIIRDTVIVKRFILISTAFDETLIWLRCEVLKLFWDNAEPVCVVT